MPSLRNGGLEALSALTCASEEPKAGKEVFLEAVKHYGKALYFASGEPKAVKEVVPGAVRQYARALKYASEELKAEKEVVPEAVEQSRGALEHAPPSLRNGGLEAYTAGLWAAYTAPVYVFTYSFHFCIFIPYKKY